MWCEKQNRLLINQGYYTYFSLLYFNAMQSRFGIGSSLKLGRMHVKTDIVLFSLQSFATGNIKRKGTFGGASAGIRFNVKQVSKIFYSRSIFYALAFHTFFFHFPVHIRNPYILCPIISRVVSGHKRPVSGYITLTISYKLHIGLFIHSTRRKHDRLHKANFIEKSSIPGASYRKASVISRDTLKQETTSKSARLLSDNVNAKSDVWSTTK